MTMSTESGMTALHGLNDIDSHEMLPIELWADTFGEAAASFIELCNRADGIKEGRAENSLSRPDLVADAMPITEESVWEERGPSAPSAIDLARRPEVLDVMDVNRQLVYPGFGLIGVFLAYHPMAHEFFGYDPEGVDRVGLGLAAIREHNKWCADAMHAPWGDRARPVGIVVTNELDQMISDAEELLASGVRAIMIPNGKPPGGRSPADRDLDPFYRLLAEADVPLTFHIGTEFMLLSSLAWESNVPEFVSALGSSVEFPIQPYRAATVNFASENFLAAMVLGGVFERHPSLRCGSIEVGAQWVGPFAERLDLWASEFKRRYVGVLSMIPSEYVNRNVRVTPFHFENVAGYFRTYPNLRDVYCFSTDYPHREGGRYAKRTFLENMRNADPGDQRRFFIENGSLLLPD